MLFRSDVVLEILTILPSLTQGVWIHLHDVFTPYDDSLEWLTKPLFSNNESYALEALLSGGRRYAVEIPLFLLWKGHRESMKRLFLHKRSNAMYGSGPHHEARATIFAPIGFSLRQ